MLVITSVPFAAPSLAGDPVQSPRRGEGACRPREIQKIASPAETANDLFGLAVAILGEQILVAAPLDDAAAGDAGAVYVFERAGDAWVQVQQIVPSGAAASQRFGWSLAIDPDQPDVLVVGSPGDSGVAPGRGSAYVFTRRSGGDSVARRNGGLWTEAQKLEPSDLDAGSWFGVSMALDGDTLAIGAPFESNDVASLAGSAFVFERSGTAWSETQKLLPQANVTFNGAAFGSMLDVEGALIAVGAPYIGMEYLPGAVEVFELAESAWVQEDRFLSSIWTGRDRFGSSLAFAGDSLVIGGPRMPPPPNGLVHTFERNMTPEGAEWGAIEFFLSDEPTYNDQFGGAIATDGDRMIAGAPNQQTTGAAFLHSIGAGTALTFEHMISASDAEEFDLFGLTVAMAGDLVAIGAPNEDEAAPDAGAVYVFELDALPAADLDGDGTVGFADLTLLLLSWGACPAPPALCPADVTRDDIVGFADLTALLVTWGPCATGR